MVNAQWFGSEALELTYKTAAGKVANELRYRHDEPRLELVEQGRPWSFDGDGALYAERNAIPTRTGPAERSCCACPTKDARGPIGRRDERKGAWLMDQHLAVGAQQSVVKVCRSTEASDAPVWR